MGLSVREGGVLVPGVKRRGEVDSGVVDMGTGSPRGYRPTCLTVRIGRMLETLALGE